MERRVVVTGYGVINAVGQNKVEVYKNLFEGKSGIRKIALKSPNCNDVGSFGYIKLVGQDDFFESNELPYDKGIELALRAAKECIDDSKINERNISEYRKGICVGTSQGGMLSGDKFHKQWIRDGLESTDPKLLKQYPLHAISDILAKKFCFKGVKSTISTACAASGNAVGFGYDMIKSGKYDVMLVGGSDTIVPFSFGGFRSLKALDPNNCKPYSNSSGINLGEGAAFFILEDYEGAKERGAKIDVEVIGYGLSADAYHQTAPDIAGGGATRAIQLAMDLSGVTKDDISYINGHGTGTTANDKTETKAYMKLFKDYIDKIPMSSIKGSIGHCLGAAGAVECAASIIAIENSKLPPTINFDEKIKKEINHVPNKSIDCECNVVLSNSFAFGGNNCCLALAKLDNTYKGVPYEEKEIVITGIGCAGVGGADIEAIFKTFDDQKICISDVTGYSTDNLQCKQSGIMPDIDYKKYIPSALLRRIDEVTKLTITSGKQALNDSKLKIVQSNMNRIGVIYATATGPLETIERINRAIITSGFDDVNPADFPNSVINAAPGNFCIANSLKGPTSTLSTGGTSALVAFSYACELIRSGQADVIVVVSADENNVIMHSGNDRMSLLSKSGISPLCDGVDGMILSEGSVAFVIESKEHAKNRDAHIYAKVKGYSITSDYNGLCTNNTNGDEYAKCLQSALEDSNLSKVDLFVSGAVGAKDMDSCELNALSQVFDKDTYLSNPQACIGATSGSVGAYGILNAIYSFKNDKVLSLPKKAKGEINELLHMNYVKGENQSAKIQTACIGSSSYGGGYAAIVLEKYQESC